MTILESPRLGNTTGWDQYTYRGHDVETPPLAYVSTDRNWLRPWDENLTVELVHSDPSANWLQEVLIRLNELLALPENWNGYGESRINPSAAKRVFSLLDQLREFPTPWIVPTNDGGLQVEWHIGDDDLEVEVQAEGDARVFSATVDQEDEWVISAQAGVKRLAQALERFAG